MAISNLLRNPTNAYPIFKANQVLTEAQLNRMIEYSDEQNRLTRVLLLGTGVACGLEPVWKNGALHVSPGFGVSSDGYLITEPGRTLATEPDAVLNYYHLLDSLPEALFGWKGTGSFQNVAELTYLDSGTADPEVLKEKVGLTQAFLANKVLVYLLQIDRLGDQGLCNNDCDGRSDTRQFTLRRLLFSEADAQRILRQTYAVNPAVTNLQDEFYHKYFLPHLAVPRFGYAVDATTGASSARLDEMTDYSFLSSNYDAILKKFVAELAEAVVQAHRIFSPLLTPGETNQAPLALLSALVDKITGRTYDIFETQYLYDHLNDLHDAYVEFVEAAFDLVADCNFQEAKHFPNYLMIRKFGGEDSVKGVQAELEPFSIFRIPYTQPPIYNGNQHRLTEVRGLFDRLRRLAEGYTVRPPLLLGAGEIVVTPSKSFRAPLSARAMPYYYDKLLADYWNPHRNRFHRKGQVYSYDRVGRLPYRDPLVYEMEGSDFFRIEGHIGHEFGEAMLKLDGIRVAHNLPFQVIALKIGENFNNELFKSECENFECQLQEHREKYLRVKEDFQTEVINQLSEADRALITSAFMATLTEILDAFDYGKFSAAYDLQLKLVPILVNNLIIPVPLFKPSGKVPFQQVSACFEDIWERLEETKKLHLFHYFARKYPGLDHRGGVPSGGTFILVYAEPEAIQEKINAIVSTLGNDIRALVAAKDRLVVADFYLPYTCCSSCPPICYMVARPKPIFIVTPSIFCSNDSGVKELTIVAYPGGGQISGPGYRFVAGKHEFLPGQARPMDANGQVKLRYLVDGAEAEALISLVDPPKAEFNLELNETLVADICEQQGPINLVADGAVVGSFYHVENNQEVPLTDGLFHSEAVAVEPGTTVQITIRYRVQGGYCGNEIDKVLTIHPLPNPAFSFADDVLQVCQDRLVKLLPVALAPESIFSAFLEGNIAPVPDPLIFRQELDGLYFNPSVISLAVGKSVNVRVQHGITTPGGCSDSSEHSIRVFAKPPAIFSIPSGNTVCWDAEAVKLVIDPSVPASATRKFSAAFNGGAPVNLVGSEFTPGIIPNPPAEGTKVVIRLEVTQGPCVAISREQVITVFPVPEIGFEAQMGGDSESTFVVVSNIKMVPGGNFQWTFDPAPEEPVNPPADVTRFTVVYPTDVTLPITVTLTVERGGCTETLTKTLWPSVSHFELQAITANGVQVVRRILDNNAVILRSEFGKTTERFNIRAVTLPNIVERVELKLLGGGQNRDTTSITAGNYRIDEGAPPALSVKPGKYSIEATVFPPDPALPLPGRRVEFTIEPDPQAQPPVDPSDATVAFLRKRDNAYRTTVSELGNDAALAQTKVFQSASAFLHFQGGVDEFNQRYSTTATELLNAIGKAKADSPLRGQLLRLVTVTTQYFMDKQVFQETKELSAETTKVLQGQLKAMKKAGLKLADLRSAWEGEALQAQLSAPSVGTILKILK